MTDDNSRLLNFSVTCGLLVGRGRGSVLSAMSHFHSDIQEALLLNFRELDMGTTCSGFHTAQELTWEIVARMQYELQLTSLSLPSCQTGGTTALCITMVHFVHEHVAPLTIKTAKHLINLPYNLNTPLWVWAKIFCYWEFFFEMFSKNFS